MNDYWTGWQGIDPGAQEVKFHWKRCKMATMLGRMTTKKQNNQKETQNSKREPKQQQLATKWPPREAKQPQTCKTITENAKEPLKDEKLLKKKRKKKKNDHKEKQRDNTKM